MKVRSRVAAMAAGLLALALALAASGCSAKTAEAPKAGKADAPEAPKVVRIAYLPITHSAPLMLADARTASELAGVKLELVKFASWPELTDALNSGKVDGAVTMLELALASAAKGVPLELVALSHRNGDGLTVAKDVSSVKDLKGQRVAIPHRLSGHNILLKLALEREGLTLDDVTRVEMAPAEMPAALARGDVKGYIVAEPFGAIGVAKAGGKSLVRAPELWPDWPCCGLVFGKTFAEENPGAVQEAVSAFVAAGDSIGQDQAAAVAAAAKYTAYGAEVWTKSLELGGIGYDDLTPRAEEIDRLQAELVAEKLLPAKVDPGSWVNDSFVKKAYGDR